MIRAWATLRSCLLLLLLAAGAGSCGPLLPPASGDKDYFVLIDPTEDPAIECRADVRILVRETKGNPFINSHKIVFNESPTTRGYYQLAQWVEPPTARLTLLLIEHLDAAKAFRSVSRLASSSLGDYQLNTEITDFRHDVADSPGSVKVRVIAEVVSLRAREVIGSRSFERVVPSPSYDAAGAVTALNHGVGEVLRELARWLCAIVSNDKGVSNEGVSEQDRQAALKQPAFGQAAAEFAINQFQ